MKLHAALAILLLSPAVAEAQKISDTEDFWEACSGASEHGGFESCMAVMNGVYLYAMMQDSGLSLCTEGKPSIDTIAKRLGQVGRQGKLDEYADHPPEPVIMAVFRDVYSC